MGIQRWQPNEGVLLHATRVGWFVSYTDHVAHTAALVQALRTYMALDHDDCTGTEYESRCKACAAKKQAQLALDGQP